ncbi:MAG: hypothetical protein RDU20_18425 [Desulfomonilaceae bacterium]|nr:hypothetical protein [Desulfomonilaceae bacterium]
MAAPAGTKRQSQRKKGTEGRVNGPVAPPNQAERAAAYDPLASRIRLMEALWEEFREWSRRAKEEEKPDTYVIKILQMLEQSMQKCDELLERLRLLSPDMCAPRVRVDLSLCRLGERDTARLPVFFDKLKKKLEESAMPIVSGKPSNETELLSQSDRDGSGSPFDVEIRERGEAGQSGNPIT